MKDINTWRFEHFLEEIEYLSEILEVPGAEESRAKLVQAMWKRFPNECKSFFAVEDQNG